MSQPTSPVAMVGRDSAAAASSRPRARGLRLRILVAASIGLVILAAVAVATVISGIQVRRSLNTLLRLHLAAETFRSVNNNLLTMESSQRGLLLTGDSTFLAPYDSAAQAIDRRMDSLHLVLQAVPGDSIRFSTLDSLVSVRITQIGTVVAAYQPSDPGPAIREMRRNQASGAAAAVRSILRTLDRREEQQRIDAAAASIRNAHRLVVAELVGGTLALVLLLVALRQIFADLDAREQAESSLRRSERFLDSVIDVLPLMVVVKDARDLRIIRFNRSAEQLLGLDRDQVLGHDDFDLFPRPLAEGFATLDRAVLASDRVRDIPEETVVAPNGAVRTLHTRKVAIRDDAGQPAFLLGVSEDITERKRAEADMLRASELAEAANRAKSDFLAKMSHELRTPLNSIIGFSQLLDEESFGPLNERQHRYVTNVLTSGRQLLDLINDVLDLSKVEAGRMELSLAHMALASLLQECLALVEPLAERAGLRLALDAPGDLPPVLVDASRFRQILYNLLGNAIKFTAAGGSITVRAAMSAHRSRGGAPMVRISVIDTGVGIRPEDLERIFREFEQAEHDGDQQGTGLGLALARRLAELHGGRVWAESEFGMGSSFHVEIPAAGAAIEPAQMWLAELPAHPDGSDRQLLLVYDTATAAPVAAPLETAGYRVAHAQPGADTMAQVTSLRPAAVVVDVAQPGAQVLRALSLLKSDPRTAATPIVLAAGLGPRASGVPLGPFDWIDQPVSRDALVAALQRVAATATSQHPLVLVIDDDAGALDVMGAVLEGAGFRVVSTTDAGHGAELARTMQPAAIVVNLIMPIVSGLAVLAALRSDPGTRTVPVIVCGPREFSPADTARLEADMRQSVGDGDAPPLLDALTRAGLGAVP